MNNIMINTHPNHYRSESNSEEEMIPQEQAINKRAADAYLRIVPSSCRRNIEETNGVDVIALCGIAKYDAKVYCGSSKKKEQKFIKKKIKKNVKNFPNAHTFAF